MPKIWLPLLFFLIFAPLAARAADRAAPECVFSCACTAEIENYCADYVREDLGDCLMSNYDLLAGDCQDDIFFWAGERYGFHDLFLHDQWMEMSANERHSYIQNHGDDISVFKARATENLSSSVRRLSVHQLVDGDDNTPDSDHYIQTAHDYTPDPNE